MRCCLLEGYDTKNTRQDNSILKVLGNSRPPHPTSTSEFSSESLRVLLKNTTSHLAKQPEVLEDVGPRVREGGLQQCAGVWQAPQRDQPVLSAFVACLTTMAVAQVCPGLVGEHIKVQLFALEVGRLTHDPTAIGLHSSAPTHCPVCPGTSWLLVGIAGRTDVLDS